MQSGARGGVRAQGCHGPTVCVAPACRGFAFRPSPGSGFASRPSPAVCDPPMGGPSGLRSAHPGAKLFAIRPSDGSAVCDPPVRRLSGLRSAIEGPGGLRSANARAWVFAFRSCAGSIFALPSKARARHGLRSPRSSRPSANRSANRRRQGANASANFETRVGSLRTRFVAVCVYWDPFVMSGGDFEAAPTT